MIMVVTSNACPSLTLQVRVLSPLPGRLPSCESRGGNVRCSVVVTSVPAEVRT